jgi:hypothetical protein
MGGAARERGRVHGNGRSLASMEMLKLPSRTPKRHEAISTAAHGLGTIKLIFHCSWDGTLGEEL